MPSSPFVSRNIEFKRMRVLFLFSGTQDYLADGLFHGLRFLLGPECVDVPRNDSMYTTLGSDAKANLRGRGFTLYGLLPELPQLAERRTRWTDEIGLYDLVVIGNIWRQWRQTAHPAVRDAWQKVVLVDGEDGPAVFPYALRLCKSPWAFFSGISLRPYFKREWLGGAADYGRFANALPQPFRRKLRSPKRIYPISFGIPAEKVGDVTVLTKKKDFPSHLVDPELAQVVSGSFFSGIGSDKYLFENEEEYIGDLRISRFGVTSKRGGWDCLRHYELAANGCVLCFRDLDQKPPTCAPHGLTASNTIPYKDSNELARRVKHMSSAEYQNLLAATSHWVRENTTLALAQRFLPDAMASLNNNSGNHVRR